MNDCNCVWIIIACCFDFDDFGHLVDLVPVLKKPMNDGNHVDKLEVAVLIFDRCFSTETHHDRMDVNLLSAMGLLVTAVDSLLTEYHNSVGVAEAELHTVIASLMQNPVAVRMALVAIDVALYAYNRQHMPRPPPSNYTVHSDGIDPV